MQVVLVMFRGEETRRSFSVARDVVVIGRREDCDFRIPLSDISRKHCRLIRDNDTLRVEDLGSSNGTFVNGERVQEATLNAGDTIQVGPVMFVLQVDGNPAEDQMHPVAAPADQASPADSAAAESAIEPPQIAADDEITPPHEVAHDSTGPLELAEASIEPPVPAAAPAKASGRSRSSKSKSSDSEEPFDPMAVLGNNEDSTANVPLDGSQIGQDVLVDLERGQKSDK